MSCTFFTPKIIIRTAICATLLILLSSKVWGILALNIGTVSILRVKTADYGTDSRLFLNAERWFRIAHNEPSTSYRSLWGFGRLWEENGNVEQAQVAFEQLNLLNPKDPLVHLMLGDLYAQSGKFEKAIQEYTKIKHQSREEEAVILFLDLLDKNEEKYSSSEKQAILYQALEIDPQNIVVAYRLIELLDASDIELRSKLIQNIQKFSVEQIFRTGYTGMRMSNHLAQVVPKLVDYGFWDLNVAIRVSDWWRRIGYYESAEIALNGLLNQYPSNVSIQEQLAQVLFDIGEWEKSIQIANNILDQYPDSKVANRILIVAYDALGEVSKVELYRTEYRKLAPGDWWDNYLSAERYEQWIVKSVAELLQIPPDKVDLTKDQLAIVYATKSSIWQFEVWTSGGAYGGIVESNNIIKSPFGLLNGSAVATICGLWRDDAYAGIKLLPPFPQGTSEEELYVLTFLYQVDGNQKFQWEVHGGPFDTKLWLTPSNGQWQFFVAIAPVSKDQYGSDPLTLINSGIGCLDVAKIEIRRLIDSDTFWSGEISPYATWGYESAWLVD